MKNHLIKTAVFIGFTILFASGCAGTLPAPEELQQELSGYTLPKQPTCGSATVYVVRPGWLGSAISFKVFVDEKAGHAQMGYTKGGGYIYFDIVPGHHVLYTEAENWDMIQVDAKPGEIIFLEQRPGLGFFYARNYFERIWDVQEGMYRVKTLKPGVIFEENIPVWNCDQMQGAPSDSAQRDIELRAKELEIKARELELKRLELQLNKK